MGWGSSRRRGSLIRKAAHDAAAHNAMRKEVPHRSRLDDDDDEDPDNDKLTKQTELILSGALNLVEINLSSEFRSSTKGTYQGVTGGFCQLNFAAHKNDPSKYPMFRDLVAASPDCQKSHVTLDLKYIAELAREFDAEMTELGTKVPHAMEPTGFVFHESRCGSTLVANSLIGMDPKHHRVYSESAPPLQALTACGEDYQSCDVEIAADLFRDVVYLMGRTNDAEESNLFFKIQSAGSKNIATFQTAFPHTPWIFVYREPVQVMMSQLRVARIEQANCVRSRRSPPKRIKSLVQKIIREHASDLDYEDYCAAHLAVICESAVKALQTSANGLAVNYNTLPDILATTVLPKHFHVNVGDVEKRNIETVSQQYSKGRDNKKTEWKDDSEKKDAGASEEIKTASATFLQSSYDLLEELRQSHGIS